MLENIPTLIYIGHVFSKKKLLHCSVLYNHKVLHHWSSAYYVESHRLTYLTEVNLCKFNLMVIEIICCISWLVFVVNYNICYKRWYHISFSLFYVTSIQCHSNDFYSRHKVRNFACMKPIDLYTRLIAYFFDFGRIKVTNGIDWTWIITKTHFIQYSKWFCEIHCPTTYC